ncbi:MAG: transposase [Caulobacteraceae bacterium]|nr:MAG: transposase [Caulobacteraceae bacterium]
MQNNTIWVGLDVHAKMISVAVLSVGAKEPETSEIPNRVDKIERLVRGLGERGVVHVCYEAGPCGFALYRQLRALGVDCDVIAPSLIPRKPGERIKTDRRDAIKLARYYRAGELTPIVVPGPAQEADRDLVRAREDTRRDRTAARHRLGKFLLRHGLHFGAGKSGWTKGHWEWIRRQSFEQASAQFTFEHYVAEVERLDVTLVRLEKEIDKLARTERFASRVDRLTCLHGIRTLTAMVLLAELGDLRRFEHPRQLMAYVGLVPSENSSGEDKKRGSITKTGNTHVRRVLVESSWAYRHGRTSLSPRVRVQLQEQPAEVTAIATKATQRLGRRYARMIARGKPAPVACTAVARELCGFIWALGREPEVKN